MTCDSLLSYSRILLKVVISNDLFITVFPQGESRENAFLKRLGEIEFDAQVQVQLFMRKRLGLKKKH